MSRAALVGLALALAGIPALGKDGKSASRESTAKPAAKAKSGGDRDMKSVDRSCAADFDRGDIASARRRCSSLQPADDPVAVFWRLRLAEDPNELRRGLCASFLRGVHPDGRLLLLAGRYQFSRGESGELSDLVRLADRLAVKGREVDSLRRLGGRSE